jgi:site-specific DNA-methyltransferase (adenine-specific)/site-specific DNA-methyltransferase (cytosine-N4-specific)
MARLISPDKFRNQVLDGDAAKVLRAVPEGVCDLVVTSPPYADQRKHTYGGVPVDQYVEWFLPITAQLLRVLKPSGSFVLNIKERASNGERNTYVLELILRMRQQGWLWTEEYIWHKKNCHPGKWPNRFRDAWERCLHFTKSRHFAMYQDAVMVPMGDWRHARLRNLSDTDKRRDNSRVKSGFGKKIANWVGRDMAYPSNVLHLATECGNKNHSATFPEALPAWFIKLFTQPGDLVLDPFLGSGTAAVGGEAARARLPGHRAAAGVRGDGTKALGGDGRRDPAAPGGGGDGARGGEGVTTAGRVGRGLELRAAGTALRSTQILRRTSG